MSEEQDTEMAGRTRARGPRESEPENGADRPEKPLTHPLRARVRAKLAELGSEDERERYDARVMLCWAIQADGEYVSKVTPKEIAEALALELGAEHPGAVKWTTVEQNGCEAERHRRRMDKHPEEIARYQIRAEQHAKRVLEFADETLAGLGSIPIDSAMDAKMRAEAGAKVLDQAEKVIEREGRMLGALATGSTTTINITTVLSTPVPFEPFGAPAKVEAIMEFARTLFELAMRSDDPKQRLGAAEALRAGRGLPPLVEAKVVDEAGE